MILWKMRWMILWKKDDVVEDEMEKKIDVEDDDVKGKEGGDVEADHRSQDRDPQLVRACAVKMHVDISQ